MKRSAKSHGPPEVPEAAHGEEQELRSRLNAWCSDEELTNGSGKVFFLTGPAGCGKSSAVRRQFLQDRDTVSINCRGFVEGSEMLYGTLSTVLRPLGIAGSIVIAYNKLFNAFADFITMNQHHTHVTHILFAESLAHMRAGLAMLKAEREASSSERRLRPLVVVDHAEQLIELLQCHGTSHELSTFPLVLTKVLLRSALDEGLCDVLFVGDSTVVRKIAVAPPSGGGDAAVDGIHHGSHTLLSKHLPDLSTRCRLLHFDGLQNSALVDDNTSGGQLTGDLVMAARQRGAQPFVIEACLAQSSRCGGACFPSAVASQCGLPSNEVIAACELLVDAGLFEPAAGERLRPELPSPTERHWYTCTATVTQPMLREADQVLLRILKQRYWRLWNGVKEVGESRLVHSDELKSTSWSVRSPAGEVSGSETARLRLRNGDVVVQHRWLW